MHVQKMFFSHAVNYQHVSIAFAIIIIIKVALQEYSEHNELPNCISGTIQRYDSCLTLLMWSQIVSLYIFKTDKV